MVELRDKRKRFIKNYTVWKELYLGTSRDDAILLKNCVVGGLFISMQGYVKTLLKDYSMDILFRYYH